MYTLTIYGILDFVSLYYPNCIHRYIAFTQIVKSEVIMHPSSHYKGVLIRKIFVCFKEVKPINYITFLFPLRNTISNCNCLSVLIICF